MPKLIMLPTFEEFRRSHHDALRAHRERLRDEAVADDVLRETLTRAMRWVPWDGSAYATQS